MTTYPGDPTTPGVGSVPGVTGRLTREQSTTILKIPTLPMSYADATKLLSALAGPLAPDSFKGGLPFAYHVGGDDTVKVHLAVKSDWSLKPLYDVVAMLHGAKHPDEWVVRGNHHDGWVFGAADPLSGNVAMLSEAKALGALAKSGWRPDRTIVYLSWDGEEPMLLGSTEYAETHAAELKAKAVIYINTDGNERGFYRAGGSHEYQHLANAVGADVSDPETRRVGGGAGAGEAARPMAMTAAGAGTRRRPRRPKPAATCRSARSDRDRTIRRSSSTSACPPSTSRSAAKALAAASITRSTTATTISRASTIPG